MKKVFLPILALAMSLNASADDTSKTITLPDGTTLSVSPAATMKVVVDGETERTFNFGSYKESTYYAVDFGDGELVVTNEIGKTTSTATATAVSGVAKGEGNITVYADDAEDIWYFSTATGTNKTSSITSIDLSKLKKVQQMNLGGNAYETIDLSACDSLRTFTSANGALTTIDFSNNLELTSANLVNNQLTSVNVSKNTKLDGLTVYQNKLTELDLTNNTVMTGLYAYENNLSSVKFAEGATFKTVNLQKNAFKEIALPAISGSSSMLYLNDNELTELTVPTSVATFETHNNKLTKISLVDCTKSCKLDNNCFTISTLPVKPAGLNTASKIKKFTYTQQAPMSVYAKVTNTLDLSSELTAVGELTEGTATTVYTFVDAEGNVLTEGTDYEMANGVATFNKSFTGIHAVMTNEAFPKATGANAFMTTAFDVDCTTAIKLVNINAHNDSFYTIGGVKNAAPVKGVNISNGKKFVIK